MLDRLVTTKLRENVPYCKADGIVQRPESENKNLHPRVRVDQAVRPLPPKTLSILVGLVLKLISMSNHNL